MLYFYVYLAKNARKVVKISLILSKFVYIMVDEAVFRAVFNKISEEFPTSISEGRNRKNRFWVRGTGGYGGRNRQFCSVYA